MADRSLTLNLSLVLGTTSGTTITATQVIVQPASGGSATSSAVIPFQRGAPATSKQAGQIPANYSQGSGTIVSGTAANKATEAALAAYPGQGSGAFRTYGGLIWYAVDGADAHGLWARARHVIM
jgi:PAB1-binding protein PBP1